MNSLAKRILVGAVLAAVAVAAVVLSPFSLFGLLALWILLASWEFSRLLARPGMALPRGLLPAINLVFPAALLIELAAQGRSAPSTQWPWLLLPVGAACAYSLFSRPPRAAKLVGLVFGVIYLSLLPSHLLLLRFLARERALGSWVVLYPLIATWLNDTGAYGLGRWLGRHRLAPDISPNKTWEGFLGGLLLCAVFSYFYLGHFLPGLPPASWAPIGLLLGVAAQAGDLVESVFKREAGVKDTSTALSEHGGFLDRADSLLFTIPVFYYALLLLT